MKRTILIMCLVFSLCIPFAFADRNTPSFHQGTTSTLVKRGDAKIYRIDFIATSNNGNFAIYDELLPQTTANIKTEGQQATSGNSVHLDFTEKPLEFSTGLYLQINNGSIVIQYE